MPTTRIAVGSRVAALLGVALFAGACTWVKPTAGGEGVHVGTLAEVNACKRLGATHAKTSPRVLIFSRGTKSVERDLENLARNEAADMGADTIVPQGPTSSEGRRSFDVYRCRS